MRDAGANSELSFSVLVDATYEEKQGLRFYTFLSVQTFHSAADARQTRCGSGESHVSTWRY